MKSAAQALISASGKRLPSKAKRGAQTAAGAGVGGTSSGSSVASGGRTTSKEGAADGKQAQQKLTVAADARERMKALLQAQVRAGGGWSLHVGAQHAMQQAAHKSDIFMHLSTPVDEINASLRY